MSLHVSWIFIYVGIGWAIRATMLLVLLRRNFAPGAAIAWLGIVFLHPYIGLALYLIFGESRLGPGRVRRHQELLKRYTAIAQPDPPASDDTVVECAEIIRLATKVGHMPLVAGSAVEFLTDSPAMIDRLAADIDSATSHVHLLYYIFAPDATGRKIADALAGAAARGVKCRVLMDEFACRTDFHRNGFADALRHSGIEVVAALPSSLLRRRDLRNHRKLAVIDNQIAYNGSHNLINSDYGGRRGGPWIDLTGRFTGPIVSSLAAVFASDWAFETDHELDVAAPSDVPKIKDGVAMQVVPTGPVSAAESFRRLFLGAINTAEKKLILTTPYFVPDESTILALLSAADRGVDVTLIVPEKSDNIFTAAASRAHYATLLDAGIKMYRFAPGLLHAKSVAIDDRISLFGSANFDVRSFQLNFELTTIVYDLQTTRRLMAIQEMYMQSARRIDPAQWANRPVIQQFTDSAVALVSPLL